MQFTLHQLRVFLKIAEKKSITKAAEALHLTQPAVSIQMRKLQDQFDIPLIDTIGRKLYITEFGKEIAAVAEGILDGVREIERQTWAYKGQLVGKLKIAVVSTGKYVMPFFLSDFLKQHPGVDLAMDVTNKMQVVEGLERNEVDFALVSVLPNNIQVERVELMQNKLYLVGKAGLLENQAHLSAKELDKTPLIYREQGSATRQAMERYVRSHGISRSKSMQLTSNEAVKQAVIAGIGFSIMPLIGIKNELQNGILEIIPLEDLPIITHWNLLSVKGKSPRPIARAFLDYLEANKAKVIERDFAWYEEY